MKSEELLYSLTHVGEDLLAEAEQSILARKRRPWVGTAVAAALALAVGLGGFLLWRSRGAAGPASQIETGASTPPELTITTEPDPGPDAWMLSNLQVAGSLDDPDDHYAPKLSLIPAEERWAWVAENGGMLPVYRNLYESSDSRRTREALEARLYETAEQLGLTVRADSMEWTASDKGIRPSSDTDKALHYYTVSAETDQGTLAVRYDGGFSLIYNMAHTFTPDMTGLDLDPACDPFADAEILQLYCNAFSSYLEQQIGLPGYDSYSHFSLIAVGHDPLSSGYSAYTLAPVREDATQSLLSGQFEQIHLLTVDGKTLCGFTFSTPVDPASYRITENCTVPEGLEPIGNYPIIPLSAARAYLQQGNYCSNSGTAAPLSNSSEVLSEELVYLYGGANRFLLPYYRFWVRISKQVLKPVYVPAVHSTYLDDFPISGQMNGSLPKLWLYDQRYPAEVLVLSGTVRDYLDSNPWREDQRLSTLPVYQNERLSERGDWIPAGASALSQRLLCFLEQAGVGQDVEILSLDASGAPASGSEVKAVRAETDAGVVTVYDDGALELRFSSPVHSPSQDFSDDALPFAVGRLAELTPTGIRNGNIGFVRGLYRPENAGSFEVYPDVKNGSYGLIQYCFERVQIFYEDGKLLGYRLPGPELPTSNLWMILYGAGYDETTRRRDPSLALSEVGLYPLIRPEEARTLAAQGKWYGGCPEQPAEDAGDAWLDNMDLVYLSPADNRVLLPYYRFLVPLGSDEQGRLRCAQRFVPAVNALFLADFSAEADQPEPTGSDGDKPEPAESDEDGRPRIAGPAGTVAALQYMGGGCQSPVWGDPDGDGEQELVYWCSGPTSGLFTVGICVYGLEEGWPVLEAAQIYCLDYGGELSLSAQDGTVYLHHTPNLYDPAQGASTSGPTRRYALSLQDGRLLLDGADEAVNVRLWGDDSWTLFGRSFAALREQSEGAWLLDDPGCLIWQEPAGAKRIFAALSDNGVSVTGLLTYDPQQDGSRFCACWGVEPIEPPEDPAALAGLSPEELSEKLGPCHFRQSAAPQRLCWFTQDGKLLAVSCDSDRPGAELLQLDSPVDN